jgi:hypothetical protein
LIIFSFIFYFFSLFCCEESQGVLGKLKAELRAHVYAVLEKGESRTPSPLRDFLTTTSGRLVASLVRYTYVFICPL